MQMQHLVLFIPVWMSRRLVSRGIRLAKLEDYLVVKEVFSPADLAALLYINSHADVFVGVSHSNTMSPCVPLDGTTHLLERWKASAVKQQFIMDIQNIHMLSQSTDTAQDVNARLYCDAQSALLSPVADSDAYVLPENEGDTTFVVLSEKAFSANSLSNQRLQQGLVKQIVARLYRYMTETQVASTYFFRRYLEHLSMKSAV